MFGISSGRSYSCCKPLLRIAKTLMPFERLSYTEWNLGMLFSETGSHLWRQPGNHWSCNGESSVLGLDFLLLRQESLTLCGAYLFPNSLCYLLPTGIYLTSSHQAGTNSNFMLNSLFHRLQRQTTLFPFWWILDSLLNLRLGNTPPLLLDSSKEILDSGTRN